MVPLAAVFPEGTGGHLDGFAVHVVPVGFAVITLRGDLSSF